MEGKNKKKKKDRKKKRDEKKSKGGDKKIELHLSEGEREPSP